MFNILVTQSLRNTADRAGAGDRACGLRRVRGDASAGRRLSDLNRPTVTIMTEAEAWPAGGRAARELPIETQMNGVPGVIRVRSVSGVGLSIVYVEFNWGTDVYRNRQLIAERLAVIRDQLPANSSPVMGPISSIMGQIFADRGDQRPRQSDGAAGNRGLRPAATPARHSRVAQVIPIGGEVRQYRVSPNPAALRALSVGYDQLERALMQFGVNTGRLYGPICARNI